MNSGTFIPALKLIGSIISSTSTEHCEHFLKYGLLDALSLGWQNYQHFKATGQTSLAESDEVDKSICWVISNILVSPSAEVVNEVFNNNIIMAKLHQCITSPNQKVVKEACYVVSYMIVFNDVSMMEKAVFDQKLFALIIPILAYPGQSVDVIIMLLKTLEIIFSKELAAQKF